MYSYGNTLNDGVSCALLFVFDCPTRFKRKDSIAVFFGVAALNTSISEAITAFLVIQTYLP